MHARMTTAIPLAAALFLGSFCGAQTITATEDASGITVTIPGVFKVLIDKSRGFGARMYDLKSAPCYNLSSAYSGNGLLWVSTSPTGQPKTLGNQYYANPIEKLELLESGPARVVVRMSGAPTEWGQQARLKEVRFEEVFTLYPNGNVYGEYVLAVGEEPVSLHYLAMGLVTTGYWGPHGLNQVEAAGESGAKPFRGATASPFLLQWSNGPDYFTDILLALHEGKYDSGNLWKFDEGRLLELATIMDLTTLLPKNPIPAGSRTAVRFMIRFSDDMNGPKRAAPYVNDYRSPDKLAIEVGKAVDSDDGDYDRDGFNEREGCHVLKSETQGVGFTIHGSAVPRMDPVFKVKEWRGAAPDVILVDGMKLAAGRDFSASVRDGTLLLQILGFVDTDARIVMGERMKTVQAAGNDRAASDAAEKMIFEAVERKISGKSDAGENRAYWSGCRAELVKEDEFADGKTALKIDIRQDTWKLGAKAVGPDAGAWDGYDYLTFDVYNPQMDMNDLMFSLRGPGVKNKDGRWLKEMLLRPGKNRVELQLKGTSVDWRQAISEWELGQFQMSTSVGTKLYLTHFRLEKGGVRKTEEKGVNIIRIESDKPWAGF